MIRELTDALRCWMKCLWRSWIFSWKFHKRWSHVGSMTHFNSVKMYIFHTIEFEKMWILLTLLHFPRLSQQFHSWQFSPRFWCCSKKSAAYKSYGRIRLLTSKHIHRDMHTNSTHVSYLNSPCAKKREGPRLDEGS